MLSQRSKKWGVMGGLFLLVSTSAFAVGSPATDDDLRGNFALSCSGVLVRMNRGPDQNAVLLTNGHCAKKGFVDPDDAIVNAPYDRSEIQAYVGTVATESVTPSIAFP